MAENSKIEWCDHTFNPWMGCTKVSPGCRHCYAETLLDHRYGKVVWGPQGTRIRTTQKYWKQALKWNKDIWGECICGWRGSRIRPANIYQCPNCGAELRETRQRVFCASLADVFEERQEIRDWRLELFGLIEQTPNLDWLLLTKRPENVAGMVPVGWEDSLPSNIWMGVSVEDQRRAKQRIPVLQEMPVKVRFLSCEPLLDYVDLSEAVKPSNDVWDEINAEWDDDDEPEEFVEECEAELDWVNFGNDLVENPEHREWEWRRRARAGFKTLKQGAIDWVICGGESGPNARAMHPSWAQALQLECQEAGTPFFFKQWGEWAPAEALRITEGSTFKHKPLDLDGTMMYRVGKAMAGRLLDGREWSQFPNDE